MALGPTTHRMKADTSFARRPHWAWDIVLALGAAGCAMAFAASLHAFPPAPHQTLHGMVRDEQGNPLNLPKASVVLETPGGAAVTAAIRTTTDVDGNYEILAPMDSGVTGARYKPSAMFPAVAFRLKVRVGNVTYLPIEMSGVNGLVAEPGKTARVDLTLGEDADGDGIPDAWERTLLAATGKPGGLGAIRPNDDDDGDGISNLNEYLAGTYAFDPADGFVLQAKGVRDGRSELEFLGLRGRTYTVEASADMAGWKAVTFSLAGDAAGTPERDRYLADDVKPLRVRVGPGSAPEDRRFFRVKVH